MYTTRAQLHANQYGFGVARLQILSSRTSIAPGPYSTAHIQQTHMRHTHGRDDDWLHPQRKLC